MGLEVLGFRACLLVGFVGFFCGLFSGDPLGFRVLLGAFGGLALVVPMYTPCVLRDALRFTLFIIKPFLLIKKKKELMPTATEED